MASPTCSSNSPPSFQYHMKYQALPNSKTLALLLEEKGQREYHINSRESTAEIYALDEPHDPIKYMRDIAQKNRRLLESRDSTKDFRSSIQNLQYWTIEADHYWAEYCKIRSTSSPSPRLADSEDRLPPTSTGRNTIPDVRPASTPTYYVAKPEPGPAFVSTSYLTTSDDITGPISSRLRSRRGRSSAQSDARNTQQTRGGVRKRAKRRPPKHSGRVTALQPR